MGREVRMVPADWVHPRWSADHPFIVEEDRAYLIGRYIGLDAGSFAEDYKEWEEKWLPEWEETKLLWDNGYVLTYSNGYDKSPVATPIDEYVAKWDSEKETYQTRPDPPTFQWWAGDAPEAPKREFYMPDWPQEERTHYMMYENTSEGTPISPAFATPEELAHWLAETGASAFAGFTATYDEWLQTIKRGSAVSAVMDDKGFRSGVEALAEDE